MSTFDQRGQKVNYQYNVAGNLNFGSATTSDEVVTELKKLLQEIVKASTAGAIEPETAIDVKAKVEKAIIQADKPNPNKQSILDNINGAKALVESMVSAVGLVSGFAQAIDMVRRVL